jgi:hypothetical protein
MFVEEKLDQRKCVGVESRFSALWLPYLFIVIIPHRASLLRGTGNRQRAKC